MRICPWGGTKGARESWLMVKDSLLKAREQLIAMHKKPSKCGKRPAWVNVKLLIELKHNREIYRRWKWGQAAWKENQRHCLYVQE